MVKPLLHGIDISHHQKSIDLGKVDTDFVIMKATEGYGYTDPKFNDFAKRVKGLRGFYHFARADLNPGAAGAKKEAGWFAKTVKGHLTSETLLVLDWEAGSVKHGVTWAKTWLDEVHRLTGLRALLYTSTSVVNGHNWNAVAASHGLWLANYGKNPVRHGYDPQPLPSIKYWARPAIHQYGDKGRLPGYSGNLDLNAAYIDAKVWRTYASVEERPYVVSPFEGRFTSGWNPKRYITLNGKRVYSPHLGLDVAPPVPGTVGLPVYAMFGGIVEKVVSNRKPGQAASSGAVVHKGYSGNGVSVRNPDRERQLYIHVKPAVKEGDVVRPGDLIGHIDLSGIQTGPHLHLTFLNAAGKEYDPLLAFNRWGIEVGSKPAFTSTVDAPAPSKPAPPKPSSGKKRKGPSGQGPKDTGNIQRALAKAGYDVGPADEDYGPRVTAAVKAYQRDQNTWADAGLVPDGDWATYTQRWFDWTKSLQRVLPAWRDVPTLVIDGSYARLTNNAVRILQGNNGLHIDGIAKNKTTEYMRKHGSNIPNRPKTRP